MVRGCLGGWVEVCVSDPRFIHYALSSCYVVHINALSIQGSYNIPDTKFKAFSRPFQGLNIFFKAKQNWKKVDLLRNARRSKHTFINMLSASQLFHSTFTQLR